MFTLTASSFALLSGAYFAAGIIDAACGGGGLITLPMFIALGIPPHFMSGTNQAACLPGALVSLARYIKHKKVHWKMGIISGPVSVLGSYLGARLNLIMSEEALKTVMILLLPVIALVVLFKRDFGETDRSETLSGGQQALRAVLIGLVLGGYVGFYGAGAGTFLLLGFAMAERLDLIKASGTARFCGVFACVSAIVTYSLSDAVLWPVSLAAMAANIAGNYIGAGMAMRGGTKLIRPMFIGVLALLFLRLLMELF